MKFLVGSIEGPMVDYMKYSASWNNDKVELGREASEVLL